MKLTGLLICFQAGNILAAGALVEKVLDLSTMSDNLSDNFFKHEMFSKMRLFQILSYRNRARARTCAFFLNACAGVRVRSIKNFPRARACACAYSKNFAGAGVRGLTPARPRTCACFLELCLRVCPSAYSRIRNSNLPQSVLLT